MALTFTKETNGNVTVRQNGAVIKCLQPNLHVLCDEQDAKVLILSSSPNLYDESSEFKFQWATVTSPTYTDKEDLINQLCADFFKAADVSVTATQGPTKFVKDGVPTDAEVDNTTPANNEPLPVALYNFLGLQGQPNNTFAITPFDTSTGSRAIIDKNGALKVGISHILNGDVFGAVSPSPNLWLFGGNGNNLTQAGNERIETGANANGLRQFQTIKRARFMGSQFNIFHCGLNLPDISNPDVIFRFGVFNPIGTRNGSYFEVQGGPAPAWSVVTIKNDVPTAVPLASWTGKGAANFNPLPNLAVYEIIYNAGTVAFFQGANLLHTQAVNILGETYANQYHFNVGFEVENINGNAVNNGMEIYAGVIYRLGEERGELISRAYTADTLVKIGAGYVGKVSISRTGSAGGSGLVNIYDGVNNGGLLIGRIDVGGDGLESLTLDGTFSDGLFVEIAGTGTNTVTLNFE